VSLVDTDRLALSSDTAPQPGEAAPDILPLNEETDSWRQAKARASIERRPWLSPMNRRRLDNFRRHRRGAWSFWIFLVLFIASLFAEFIANDKPIFIHVEGKSYFPIFFTYPDTDFGDDLGTAADYRDPFTQKYLAEHNAVQVWPPIHFSYKTINDRPPMSFPSKPTWMLSKTDCDFAAKNGYAQCGNLEMNWFGTDDQGRDVLARLIYGFRLSVLFGLVLTIVSSVIGVAAGAVQGYFGGWTDLLFQRFIEIWTSVPELYVLLIIASVLPPGFFILLGLFTAAVLGGIGSAYGALAGGIVIGLAQEWSTLFFNTRWKPVVGFAILIVMLLVMPRGIFGGGRARS